MKLNFLEEIGGVKTARREAESLLLATALLRNDRFTVKDEGRMLKLARKNKVLLRAAELTHFPSSVIDEAKRDVDEAFDLYNRMSGVLLRRRKAIVEGHVVWMTSDSDRVLIRVIHAMFRHNFLKLSDILDFLRLIETANFEEVIEKIDNARIGDAFIFYLLSIERFLKACRVENPGFQVLKKEAQERFGNDRLAFLRRDRLVLPYRIPASAIIMLFLLKAARDAASARWRSSISCLVAPPLIILDFISAAFRAGGRGGVW